MFIEQRLCSKLNLLSSLTLEACVTYGATTACVSDFLGLMLDVCFRSDSLKLLPRKSGSLSAHLKCCEEGLPRCVGDRFS